MAWKTDAKQDGVRSQGKPETQKTPANGVLPGTGDVSSQMNPRRERRQDYGVSTDQRSGAK